MHTNKMLHPFDLELSKLSDLRDMFRAAQDIPRKGGLRVDVVILRKILCIPNVILGGDAYIGEAAEA